MNPDGRVEEDVVTQLFQEQNTSRKVAKVTGECKDDVQHRSCHMYFGRLRRKHKANINKTIEQMGIIDMESVQVFVSFKILLHHSTT